MNVLVYGGNGVSFGSLSDTRKILRSFLGDSHAITQVSADTLAKEPWEQHCALLVIPGGRDLPYVSDLGANCADQRILDYVRKGGKYLGICAGAYYASNSVVFEQGTPMSVVGDRPLKFYPGECQGAAFPGFVYDSSVGARSVGLSINRSAFRDNWDVVPEFVRGYWNGGGIFVDAEKYRSVQVLATYSNLEGTPAAGVKCNVGAGTAVLWAIHPEHLISEPFKSPSLKSTESLDQQDKNQKSLFRATLSILGFPSTPVIPSPIPEVKPQYLTSDQKDLVKVVYESLKKNADFRGILQDVNDTFLLVQNEEEYLMDKVDGLSIRLEKDEAPKRVVILKDEVPNQNETPLFDLHTYFKELNRLSKPQRLVEFGKLLLYTEVITSTQTLLDKNPTFLKNIPDGLVSLATHQVAGRGRGGNVWVSPAGCLQFSFVVRLPSSLSQRVVLVQYLLALAITESCRRKRGYENIDVRIKWPNDLYAKFNDGTVKKIGGILVNSSYMDGDFTLVVGTGINITNSTPTTCLKDIIEEYNSTNSTSLPNLTQEEVLAGILSEFGHMWPTFITEGFQPFLDLYHKRWLHSGQIITLQETGKSHKILGITADMGLLRTLPVGITEAASSKYVDLQPDGNSFDMLKGLIKTK